MAATWYIVTSGWLGRDVRRLLALRWTGDIWFASLNGTPVRIPNAYVHGVEPGAVEDEEEDRATILQTMSKLNDEPTGMFDIVDPPSTRKLGPR